MNPALPRRLLLAVIALPGTALAKPDGERGNGQDRGHARERGGQPERRGPSLGPSEAALVQGWLSANPGFAGQPLPPGMRNRLAKGKPLPPGIARRALPPDLALRLPRYPGHDYLVVGATVVLVEATTGLVREALYDVLLPR
jgi:hypothetical protein